MAIGPSSSGHPASPSPRQRGNTKRSRSLPLLTASPRLYTPTSSIISTPGTSRTKSGIPTPMTSRESSSSPPLSPGPKPSSSQSSLNTRTSKTKGQENFPSEKIKGKSLITPWPSSHSSPVLHISKSSFSLIRDTGEGYDFGLPASQNVDHLSSQYVDIDKLARMICQCAPLRNELASITQDLVDLKSHVAALEAIHKKMQRSNSQPESVAVPQTARQKEKSPQKEFQPLIYASASETAQVTQFIPESSKDGEMRNDIQQASSETQDTIIELRDEIERLRNKNRALEDELRAHRSANVKLIPAPEEVKAAKENEQFQPSAQQCGTTAMDLDQEASGPSNTRGSGRDGDSSSRHEETPPQQVTFQMIQRLNQEQEYFENVTDPDDMVTEVHTNQQISEVQARDTVIENDPLIETGYMQHDPIITQQDIPLARSYRSPSALARNTAGERSNEVSRLKNTYRKLEAIAVVDTTDHRMEKDIQMTLEEFSDPIDVTAVELNGKEVEIIGTQHDISV
ncbi:hypothetical protein FPRO06_13702 [Fusarium proliferatum]|nr:hypothetical protein FPRO06_13702 [Fusarium proliferatum]